MLTATVPLLLLALDDVMVASRIETTARHLGYEVRYARTPTELSAGLDESPALVMMATHQTRVPWEALLQQIRERGDAPPVLAFGSHVDIETRQRAKLAGATRWVANSRMAADLPGLIAEMARRS